MSILDTRLEQKTKKMVCPTHGEQQEIGFMNRWFGCPVCNEQCKISEEAKRKAKAQIDAIEAIGIPEMYRTATFKNWINTDDRQPEVLRRLGLYVGQLKQPKAPNLVLSGNTGTGKTRLAACVLRHVANSGARCKFLPSADLIGEIRMSWEAKTRTKFEVEIIRNYGSVPVLVIDEMGIADGVSKAHDIWSSLFDQRYRNRLPTIITTNLTKDQLKVHIGDRAYDRLMESVIWGNCIWVSYREANSNVEDI